MITLQERVHGVKPKDNWSLSKLHQIFIVRKNNKNIGMKESNLLSLSYGRIKNKDINSNQGLLPESFETYQIVEKGDIILRLTDLQNDKRSIRQGLVTQNGIITSAYDAVFVTKGNVSNFWAYALYALDLAKYYYSMGGGVRQSMKFKDFPNDWLFVPKESTQKKISLFLDKETLRIEKLINTKHKIINLLKEKLQAEVDASFENFDTRRLKTVSEIQFSSVDKHIYEDEIQVRACHYTDVYYNDVITSEHDFRHGSVTIGEKQKYSIHGGEVLLTKDSETPDDIGIPAYVESCKPDTVCGYHLGIIRPNLIKASGGIIFWALKTKRVRDYYKLTAQGVTRFGLGLSKISDTPIPYIENLEVQSEISSRLFFLAEQHSKIISKIQESINILKELKVSLITDAVNGQLDISSWSSNETINAQIKNIEKEMS